MARCRQCLYRLALYEESSATELASASDAPLAEAAGSTGEDVDGTAGPPFRLTVDSFNGTRPVMFHMTIRRGDAVWRIRRRFGNIWAVHTSLLQGCGRSAIENGLPRPPPRASLRSLIFGQFDRRFLENRSRQIEQYFQALFAFIPAVEQCEALYCFLCYVQLPRWEGDGYMVGGGAPPVDAHVIDKLPKALDDADVLSGAIPSVLCVICQDSMDLYDKEADIRILPCGHQFHFNCIAGWLKQRNTCCICNGAAVPSAPHFMAREAYV